MFRVPDVWGGVCFGWRVLREPDFVSVLSSERITYRVTSVLRSLLQEQRQGRIPLRAQGELRL